MGKWRLIQEEMHLFTHTYTPPLSSPPPPPPPKGGRDGRRKVKFITYENHHELKRTKRPL